MDDGTKDKKQAAPYISWKTFTSFLANMKGKLPAQIDTSVLRNMSGTGRSQLLSTLRFLDLISIDGTVKDKLRELCEAYNTSQWKEELRSFLTQAYTGVIGNLDITTCTPAMLRERFKNFGGVEGTTIDNALRFYIGGLKEAEIPYSQHISIRAPRAAGGTVRKRTGTRPREGEEQEQDEGLLEGTFRIPLDILGLVGTVTLPEDIDGDQWKAVSQYVETVIGLRQRARKTNA